MTEFAARVSRVRMKGGADVHIIEPRAINIPFALRRMADEIDAGEHGYVESICLVAETSDGLGLHGFGNIDGLRSIGLFSLAIQKLNGIVLSEIDE